MFSCAPPYLHAILANDIVCRTAADNGGGICTRAANEAGTVAGYTAVIGPVRGFGFRREEKR